MHGYGNDIITNCYNYKYCYNNEINKTTAIDCFSINDKA